jgi:aminoglycoside 2''-phosphotransferase
MDRMESYRKRIREIFPELQIGSIVLNDEGLANDVVVVNDELVFRFPKYEYAVDFLRNEFRILKLLEGYLSLRIPVALYESEDVMCYRMIAGEPLRRDVLLRLDAGIQQSIADQLAGFHQELHHVPVRETASINASIAVLSRENWVEAYRRIQDKVLPLMQSHTRAWARQHFESFLADESNFEYERRLIHGDVAPYHVLFDKRTNRINGIIDFGCAGLGDPALDIGVIINQYGESFLERFYRVYPAAQEYLKRARFYAGAIEMRWILTGIESGDPSWFAVHLNSAKDVKYDS